jgi:glutaredoxin 3
MSRTLTISTGILTLLLVCAIYNHDSRATEMTKNNHSVTIYYVPTCPYCKRAIEFLETKKVGLNKINIASDADQWRKLQKETGSGTVPYIFIDGQYIGGCTDLLALDENGELDKLLK